MHMLYYTSAGVTLACIYTTFLRHSAGSTSCMYAMLHLASYIPKRRYTKCDIIFEHTLGLKHYLRPPDNGPQYLPHTLRQIREGLYFVMWGTSFLYISHARCARRRSSQAENNVARCGFRNVLDVQGAGHIVSYVKKNDYAQ